jgi:hypothetical protein
MKPLREIKIVERPPDFIADRVLRVWGMKDSGMIIIKKK